MPLSLWTSRAESQTIVPCNILWLFRVRGKNWASPVYGGSSVAIALQCLLEASLRWPSSPHSVPAPSRGLSLSVSSFSLLSFFPSGPSPSRDGWGGSPPYSSLFLTAWGRGWVAPLLGPLLCVSCGVVEQGVFIIHVQSALRARFRSRSSLLPVFRSSSHSLRLGFFPFHPRSARSSERPGWQLSCSTILSLGYHSHQEGGGAAGRPEPVPRGGTVPGVGWPATSAVGLPGPAHLGTDNQSLGLCWPLNLDRPLGEIARLPRLRLRHGG